MKMICRGRPQLYRKEKTMPALRDLFDKLPCPCSNDRVLLLTHNDLDGAGATILTKAVFKNANVINCSNGNMDEMILQEVTSSTASEKYDLILICDISCGEETARIIDSTPNRPKLVLLDHHQTATDLNKYDWACVSEYMPSDSVRACDYKNMDNYKAMQSGTAWLYDFLCFHGLLRDANVRRPELLSRFVQLVSEWDTWEWTNVFHDDESKKLNSVFHLYDMKFFTIKMLRRLASNENSLFRIDDEELLEIEQTKIDAHLKSTAKNMYTCSIKLPNDRKYSAVFCSTGKYISDVFEMMKNTYPDKDLYIICYGTGISIRTVNPEINAADIASRYEGGGHPGAAGFTVSKECQANFIRKAMRAQIRFTKPNPVK